MEKVKKGLVVLLAVVCFGIFAADGALPSDTIEEQYTVHYGDTLWDVMSRKVGNEHDVRKYVYLTEQRNLVKNAHLEAGERIVLVLPK